MQKKHTAGAPSFGSKSTPCSSCIRNISPPTFLGKRLFLSGGMTSASACFRTGRKRFRHGMENFARQREKVLRVELCFISRLNMYISNLKMYIFRLDIYISKLDMKSSPSFRCFSGLSGEFFPRMQGSFSACTDVGGHLKEGAAGTLRRETHPHVGRKR